MRSVQWMAVCLLVLLFWVGGRLWADALTGDEILSRVDEQGEFVGEGSLITTLRFETVHGDGTTSEYLFAALGKREEGGKESLLLYFLKPEDLEGMILLSIGSGGSKEESRIWLFSPGLEAFSPGAGLKELVAEERKQSFAGSTLSREEISGVFHFSEDYDAELSGEETLDIGGKAVPCYLLQIMAKPGAKVDHPAGRMWVAKETFLILRGEYLDDEGTLERTMEILALGEFEGHVTIDALVNRDISQKSSTTIYFEDRRRPSEEFPDALFSPDALPTFDPVGYGIKTGS